MKTFQLQPIPNLPALFIQNYKTLIIADLHIGIENELLKYGVNIEPQTNNMKYMLLKIIKEYNPNEIMILGDIKHSIPSTPFIERKQIYDFLKDLSKHAIIHILPGNHDGGIEKLIPGNIILHKSNGLIKNNIGLIHGHRWPKNDLLKCNFLIFGHTHPTIMLTDRLGFKNYEPCWIKTNPIYEDIIKKYNDYNKKIQFIILPAFNPLCGGIAINKEGIVGPIKNIINKNDADIFLLDGSQLGKVKNLI